MSDWRQDARQKYIWGCKPRECFICRESPPGRRFQTEKDGPLVCERCALEIYKDKHKARKGSEK